MRRLILASAIGGFLLGLSGLSTAAPVNLIQNGSFETYLGIDAEPVSLPQSNWTQGWRYLRPESQIVPGWTATEGVGELMWLGDAAQMPDGVSRLSDNWVASHGNFSIEIKGGAFLGLGTSFATIPGQRYRVLFDLSPRPQQAGQTFELDVTLDGVTERLTIVNPAHQDAMLYRTYSREFIASGSSADLHFLGISGGAYNHQFLVLDDVRAYAAVPLGGLVGLMALSALTAMARSRPDRV